MNKCPHCGAVLKTLTRVCEACGSEIKPEASASSESSTQKSAGLSAGELTAQINESLAALKSQPPDSRFKAFFIGLFLVPTIGLSYFVVKAVTAFGRIGRSPERVKLSLDQNLRAAETSFKSDTEMKAVIDKGRSELKAYLQSQHESRMSLGVGVVVSIILCVTIPLVIQHQAKVRMEQAAALAQIEAAAARVRMEQAAAAAQIEAAAAKVRMDQAIAVAQKDPLKRLCIGPIITINSVAQNASQAGQSAALQQTLETLDTTLIDQANRSHKFEVVARNDALKSILNEQSLGASGNVDPATAAQVFKLVGAQYLVLPTVTDFVVGDKAVKFESVGVTANREAVRISCSVQIYDTTTGKLVESARFRGQDANVSSEGNTSATGASLTKITDRLAADIFSQIVNVIYPAKVASKLGTQITINRGEGAGVTVGQVWSVFALGEEITDSDTGRKLGRNETEVGTIKIVRTTATLSYGDASADNGIAVGNIVRLKPVDTPPAPAHSGKAPGDKSISDKVKDDM